ncbi:MAG TPA: 3-keto-5-aminohexanoate cleavage protein, partial [Syntrophorhabdales bacterium]|nr:3-keto-5-aminohexanoate cleavage protein [Syntrophorhabdales bacterium]
MEKLIITAAVAGALTTRQHNPNLPHTPEEIARAAIDSCKAGASVVHLHARDPVTGHPLQKAELFAKIIRIIRSECDIVINTSTGGGPGIALEDRIGIIPELATDPEVKPEMASLNCGSLNVGMLDRKKREFTLNDVQMNPWASMLHFADTLKKHTVVPELEIYDTAMINNALVLRSLDALGEPLHFQFVLGVLGGLQATAENLVFLKNSIPPNATWSLIAAGLNIYTLGAVAIALGGHVRTGLEDGVHIEKGVLANDSAQMVAKIARISKEMGRD